MSELLKTLRLAVYVLALPIAVTAAVSAHQQFIDGQPLPKTDIVATSFVSKISLSGTFRNHIVSTDENGSVRGRITAVGSDVGVIGLGKTKVMLVRGGTIDHLIETQVDGSFELKNVEHGDYSLIASGKQGFAAFGVRVTDVISEHSTNVIEIATVNPGSLPLRRVLESVLPMKVLEQVDFDSVAGVDTIGSNRVRLTNGKLVGRLTSFVSAKLEGTKVAILNDDKKVAETDVDANGGFAIENLAEGVYELVAVGQSGLAVLTFEAVAGESVTNLQNGADGYYFASATTETYNNWLAEEESVMEIATTLPQDNVVVQEQMGYVEGADVAPVVDDYGFAGTEIGCGTAVGGCCGGAGNFGGCCGGAGGGGMGGGGFGGAGLGGIARFAILGWILTELFDEIDFANPNPPSPAN